MRLLLVAAVTVAVVVRWGIGALLALGNREVRRRRRRNCMRAWCRGMCRALGVRVDADQPPADLRFLVANHLGYVDILVLGSLAPVAFVSRADVAGWPVIGPLARCFDTVFLARERKRDLPQVNAVVAERLASGCALALFPEGTSTDGAAVLPFRPSLLATAADAGLPVHAAALHYATHAPDEPAARSVCWVGDAPFLPHALAMLSVRRIDATVRFARQPRTERDRKRLAAALQADVEAMFCSTA